VSQPFDRGCHLEPAGELDNSSGQFWVSNPWRIVSEGHNLSAFERHATYLNLGGERFADVSFVTGTDSDGDGRGAIAADLDGDGMQDLIVRQAGGGPLLIYRNQFPTRHWLRVKLHGTRSNSMGIGARLTAQVGSRAIVREMYPANTYFAQQPCEVHFGLGDATTIDRLTIRWPSGLIQQVKDVDVDQRLEITEPRDGS
jgi:hypothetical protein